MHKGVVVKDLMQQGYVYFLTEPTGKNFHPDFKPELTPAEMLALGVFGGKYMTDCTDEFPEEWFTHAKLCHAGHDPAELLRRQRLEAALVLEGQGLDLRGRPPRLVPVVLPLLPGPALPRRRAANRPLEGHAAAHRADQEELPPGRSRLPAEAAASTLALGIRQPEDVSVGLRSSVLVVQSSS